jgi:hypothetical protein
MKKILVFATAMITTLSVYAKSANDYIEVARDVLKTEKKAAIAEAMMLSESESGPFWELYNEYNFELSKVQNLRLNAIKDFAENFENLSDEKADELWTNAMSYQQQLLKLKKGYYKKFKKILPVGKAARYFQAENKLEAMINAHLALNIPLMETK